MSALGLHRSDDEIVTRQQKLMNVVDDTVHFPRDIFFSYTPSVSERNHGFHKVFVSQRNHGFIITKKSTVKNSKEETVFSQMALENRVKPNGIMALEIRIKANGTFN